MRVRPREDYVADIDLTNVSKRFGSVRVIEDVSLSIKHGEFIVFLGPSGCGKSTLLRMIAGLETIDEGQIIIGDRRVDQLPANEREVAMVFQNYALYPHMTVRQNMSFGLENIRTPKDEIVKRVNEAAKILEIEHLLDRKPAQLSGGQRQRVAIGRSIVRDPKAFLLDEPLSNLDAGLRVRTRVELAQLHRRMDATMIFVTHDQIEAMTLASRIVVMNNRKIEQVGTPMEIYTRPATRFVANFVGSPGMNFIPVTGINAEGGKANVSFAGQTLQTGVAANGLPQGKLTLGIRAEAAKITRNGGNVQGVADVIERLGERTLVYTRLADSTVIVAEDDGISTINPGDTVSIDMDGTSSIVFDEAGRAYHAAA
jgi:multiple sugar transport system ATP-binding protein